MNIDGTEFTLAKNATKPNPFEIISLQTTRKENNWKTEETLARAVVTLETERLFMMMMIKLTLSGFSPGSIPGQSM